MWRATELAQLLLREKLQPGDVVVDATVGNGHDTLFLANEVGPTGRVFGFDVQQSALNNAAERLGDRPEVTLLHAGHETLAESLAERNEPSVAAVMFNLGYLADLLGFAQALADGFLTSRCQRLNASDPAPELLVFERTR